MKLLFFNHNVAWSGTFFRVFQLGRALVARGHDVTVVTTSRTARLAMQREDRDGVRLIEAPDLFWGRGRTGWDPWNVLQRTVALRGAGFDAIHAFDSRPAVILPALYHARRYNLPLFLDWADWWGRGGSIGERNGRFVNRLIGGVETWFEEAFRGHALGTTVISRALEQRAIELGVPADRILRFPNGCDAAQLPVLERFATRAQLSVSSGAEIVLHVGLVYPGDLKLLLDAMRVVVTERPEAQLILVGNPKTPVDASALPHGHLVCTGFVDYGTLQAWLGAANVCAVPLRDTTSGRGRWPGKVNDYFCAARAVAMPRVGDAADWIERAGAGWTCEATPPGYANAITTALANTNSADAAGARGRKLAETELSWASVAVRVEAFYQSMTGAARAAAPLQAIG